MSLCSKYFIIFWILLLTLKSSLALELSHKDFTIVVPSCDKYSELWEPFFNFLFKHWPSLLNENKDIPILLIGNQEKFSGYQNRITNINILEEKSWSHNLRLALKEVKTKNVLILLEDYILHTNVDETRLNELLDFYHNTNAAYLQLSWVPPEIEILHADNIPKNLAKRPKHGTFRTSLQAALWDKNTLDWLIKPGESAWQFEVAGSIRSEGIMQPWYATIDDFPLQYVNAVDSGFVTDYFVEFMQQHGYEFTSNKLLPEKYRKFKKYYRLKAKLIAWLNQG